MVEVAKANWPIPWRFIIERKGQGVDQKGLVFLKDYLGKTFTTSDDGSGNMFESPKNFLLILGNIDNRGYVK